MTFEFLGGMALFFSPFFFFFSFFGSLATLSILQGNQFHRTRTHQHIKGGCLALALLNGGVCVRVKGCFKLCIKLSNLNVLTLLLLVIVLLIYYLQDFIPTLLKGYFRQFIDVGCIAY